MKESAVAGLSYVRSLKECEKLGNDFFETHDIHIHIPEGLYLRMDLQQV